MRAVVQRVTRAAVDVKTDAQIDGQAGGEWRRSGEIDGGLFALVGVTHDDSADDAKRLAERLFKLRLFDDADGTMNLDLVTAAADGALGAAPGVLVVSQFTLYGNTRKGRRPSWVDAARPEVAAPLVDAVVQRLRELVAGSELRVETGQFGGEMRVDLVNDGPVTLVIDLD